MYAKLKATELSDSPYSTPMQIAKKPDNGKRICLDLTLKQREFHIQNKTTYMGNGGSSVYGTTPKKKKENDVKTI